VLCEAEVELLLAADPVPDVDVDEVTDPDGLLDAATLPDTELLPE
jgi:hypothetical protein